MYKTAKLSFCIRNLRRDQSADRLIPFLLDGGSPDLVFDLRFLPDLSAVCVGKITAQNESVFVYGTGSDRMIAYHQEGEVYAVRHEAGQRIALYLSESFQDQDWHHYFLPDLLHLERPLLDKDCFILHSSYIATDRGAILFTAPSGGGKTTQSDLWVEHQNARIINGDKTAVSRTDGRWYAYGLPISGSSPHCLNETHPIRAIVILDKAPENRLYEIGISGFSRILSQTILNTWDPDFCGKAMDLVAQACGGIPVYLFRCTKTSEAAQVLHRALIEKENAHGNE